MRNVLSTVSEIQLKILSNRFKYLNQAVHITFRDLNFLHLGGQVL
jgi:hypothetical protein